MIESGSGASVSEVGQSDPKKSKRFQRFRLALLIGLLVLEIILIVSLRQRGWVATTESTRWILTAIAAFLPLVVAAILLISSGRRMKLRTLFICVAAICIFLSVSLTPLISVRRARTGARELIELGTELRPVSYGDYDYDNPDPHFMNNTRFSPPDDIPSWLQPLARDWEKIPRDSEVAWVQLRDDEQVDTFVRRISNFKNVRCLDLMGVSDDGLRKLATVHDQLPQLNALSVTGTTATPKGIRELNKFSSIHWLLLNIVKFPQDGWFESFSELRSINIWDESQNANPKIVTTELSQENLAAIGKLRKLRDLTIRGVDMQGRELSSLAKLKQLMNLRLDCRNLDGTQLDRLRERLPDAKIHIFPFR